MWGASLQHFLKHVVAPWERSQPVFPQESSHPKACMGTQQLSPLSSVEGQRFFTSAGKGSRRCFSESLASFSFRLKRSQSTSPGSTHCSVFSANHPDSHRFSWVSATLCQRHKLSLTDCFCKLHFEICPGRCYNSLSSSHPPVLKKTHQIIMMAVKHHFEKTAHENNQTCRGLKS